MYLQFLMKVCCRVLAVREAVLTVQECECNASTMKVSNATA